MRGSAALKSRPTYDSPASDSPAYVGRPFRPPAIYFTATVQLTGADSGGKHTLSSHAW
jgi:hypothetical protein